MTLNHVVFQFLSNSPKSARQASSFYQFCMHKSSKPFGKVAGGFFVVLCILALKAKTLIQKVLELVMIVESNN